MDDDADTPVLRCVSFTWTKLNFSMRFCTIRRLSILKDPLGQMDGMGGGARDGDRRGEGREGDGGNVGVI